MLTVEQAKEYLDSQGVTLPDFLVVVLVEQLNTLNDCLTENYDAGTALLIQLYLLSLLGLSQGDKYISSQSAPSGASRSFRYANPSDRWRSQLSLLRGLDKYGCTSELIPEDPFRGNAGLWVATGGCGYERNR